MIWSANIYYFNPEEYDRKNLILSLLFPEKLGEKENIYVFDESDDEKLAIQIVESASNNYGKYSKAYIDSYFYLWNREKGHYKAIISYEIKIQYYDTAEVSNYLSVFGGRQKARYFINSFIRYLRKEHNFKIPILPVKFALTKRMKELKEKTGPLTRIAIKDIQDIYIQEARFTGYQLQQSEEFKKFVEDQERSGVVDVFAIKFRNMELFLSSDANIFTRHGKKDFEPHIVYEILKLLENVNAIEKPQPTLFRFF